ncbi:DUF4126 domain-containing protein [Algibacter mikhailovii]|uniref:DUF4126 domain-containing protein n=1 Tax=Algibacter mikhailovii TaxID=425498 RepID=UPI00249429AB|nr:DUF4126 domain-containing protein [Algibacter mikhailovii]
MTLEIIISICLGIGLSASVGFRVFFPLFVLSLASYFDVLQLNDAWIWLSTTSALLTLGVASMVEVFSFFVPYIDNLLDSIAVPLAALAGTVIMLSTVIDLSPVITWSLAIIAGGGTAAAVAGTSGATRLTSTVTTGGMGNPIVSILETITSIVLSVISIFLPILAGILALFILFIIYKLYTKFKTPSVK